MITTRDSRRSEVHHPTGHCLGRDPRHEFWPDSLSFADVTLTGVIGHRQVTDAYLAQLARAHNGRLATFDRGLAELHSDVAELLSTE
ncbi:PIN domain-containing protein [Mycolicibacter algericus]|uniref:Uncharacterized protein n=1 Tax=Mycolicibacter algericus TaxID=1288388 RepID=A0A7I9Y936_MYCAL|nr:hypothetical protein [Mycolicibacter algericus]GFG85164.1 hypothetical protein MALGJ_18400 [Mycolicibacter algericus]